MLCITKTQAEGVYGYLKKKKTEIFTCSANTTLLIWQPSDVSSAIRQRIRRPIQDSYMGQSSHLREVPTWHTHQISFVWSRRCGEGRSTKSHMGRGCRGCRGVIYAGAGTIHAGITDQSVWIAEQLEKAHDLSWTSFITTCIDYVDLREEFTWRLSELITLSLNWRQQTCPCNKDNEASLYSSARLFDRITEHEL